MAGCGNVKHINTIGGWGNLGRAGGTFSGAVFGHIKHSINGGGTSRGRFFSGAGSGHVKQISTKGGLTWPRLGDFFFPGSVIEHE